ncbi:MAG: siderophore-interacting protein [Propionibacteriaceae bacterium]
MTIHHAVVTAVRQLTPSLVRVTFSGDGLADFETTGIGDEYVRVWFPSGADRSTVELPVESGRGWEFPDGVEPSPMRTYTVRAVRPATADSALEVDIDFVVHDGGVAATWAQAAAPGDVVGLNTPHELYEPPADAGWQVLVADLTGLPAVARLLENRPAGLRTTVVAEVPGPEHEIELDIPAKDVLWLHGGNGHGPSRIAQAVREIPIGTDDTGYVWVAGETSELRDVRKYLRKELGLTRERFCLVGYWTHKAEEWRDRWAALSEEIKSDLLGMWSDEDRDRDDIEDEYTEKLEKLGL